jgi:hypothetical protein
MIPSSPLSHILSPNPMSFPLAHNFPHYCPSLGTHLLPKECPSLPDQCPWGWTHLNSFHFYLLYFDLHHNPSKHFYAFAFTHCTFVIHYWIDAFNVVAKVMDFRIEDIFVKFIGLIHAPRRHFTCVLWIVTPSLRLFQLPQTSLSQRSRQMGMASIDIVHM